MVNDIAFHALLVAAALAVAALVGWPLRKASPRLSVALLVAVPALAFALYRIVGTPAALAPGARTAAAPTGDAPSLETAIAELEAALARDPSQPDGWRLLGRSYTALGQHAKAREAFMTALGHIPDDPELLVEAAQARAQAEPDKRFDDEALALLRKALAIDPAHQRAQWFIGVVQRQRGEDAAAVTTWETLLPSLDAATATALREQINEARAAAGMPASTPAPASGPAAGDTPAATAGGLRVRVALDPDFASRVRLHGDAVVFVIARAAGGPPMPVAVERHALQDLPLDIVLDDGDSPMPTAKLSSLREVEVLARISASGSANRGEGDVESTVARVTLPADASIDLVIGTPSP